MLPDEITVEGFGKVHVEWRVSSRARRLALRIAPRANAITVTLPPACPPSQAQAFVRQHGGWIASRLQRLEKTPSFSDGSLIPIEGIPHRITHAPTRRGGAWIEQDRLVVSGDASFISRRVTDFLRAHAARVLGEEVRDMARTARLHPSRLDIRDTSSRWGSCSSTGRIMLSWRLVMAPQPVRHYLIAHELSHLVHMNHGPQFWKQVASLTPHRQQAEAWLRYHGPLLLRAG